MSEYTEQLRILCRTISGACSQATISKTQKRFSADAILEHMQYHQIVALVYYFRKQLSVAGWEFSDRFIEDLKSYTLLNISRVMVYEHFLKQLDALLKEHSIDYCLFKGIVTARSVYPEDYLRSFTDLDILIRPKDLQKVESLLENDGFIHADDLYEPFPDHIVQKYSFAQHYMRVKPNNVAVDIHMNLSGRLHPFQFDSEDFINNSNKFKLDGHDILTFDPEHQAIFAVYHAFKHYFYKLIWFIDAFLLLDQKDLDREKFFRLIQKYELSKLSSYFAQISSDLFGRLPVVIKDYRNQNKQAHRIINSELIVNGTLPYSKSRARILLPMYYMAKSVARLKFLWVQLFPPIETIRDFYIAEGPKKNIWNYFKLRRKAIIDLFSKVHKEE